MEKILAATDGSRSASRAVIAAAQLAKATGAELCILTVGDGYSSQDLKQLIESERDVGEVLELLANEVLDHAKKRALRAGATKIKVRSGWGDAAKVIIDTARRENADIIAVGRRGRGRIAGLLLGSVSQKIANLAPCIAMIVP